MPMRRLCTVRMALASAIVFMAFCASADRISCEDAENAAAAFLTRDSVGKSILDGRMTGRVLQRGSLWVVGLLPSGAIVLSGSDTLEPIVSFSTNDFVEPEFGSAFYDRLAQLDAKGVLAETPNAVGTVRHEKWISLIGPRERGLRLAAAAVNVPSNAVVVEPFLTTQWSQWQPYNDFSPVCSGKTVGEAYRGRAPCGCTATAASQVFAYWKWPKRVETCRYEHRSPGIGNGTFDVRFNGGVPLAWDSLDDDYAYWKNGYDLRGKVLEATRFPIARLVLWCDSVTEMEFGSSGSSAHVLTAQKYIKMWYEPMSRYSLDSELDAACDAVRTDIAAGRPVHVLIPGHAIFAHGWASDGSANYVYVNYGWGGKSDGWMPFDSENIQEVYPGLYPRRTAQVDPFPAVCDTSVNVSWTVPECHVGSVTGFRVEMNEQDETPGVWADDFTQMTGLADDPSHAYVTRVSGIGNDSDVLSFDTYPENAFTFGPCCGMTSRSVLTYRIYSTLALGAVLTVEARRDGGEWQTLLASPLTETSSKGLWEHQRFFLGGFAGEDVSFRIVLSRISGAQYYRTGRVYIDDFSLSDVLVYSGKSSKTCGPLERTTTLSGCQAGRKMGVSVTPLFGEEEGFAVQSTTRIAGASRQALARQEATVSADLAFSADDERWALIGSADGTDVQSEPWNGCFSVLVDGALKDDSALSFDWTAKGYYVSAYDVITGEFFDQTGEKSVLFSFTNTANQSVEQPFSFSLGTLAGRKGVLRVTFNHVGAQYNTSGYGVKFISPRVTNVLEPVLPDFAWEDKTFVALPAPQILSVEGDTTKVAEGFYRENALGSNVLHVTCSDTVVSLKAWPSHLSFLDDEDVSVVNEGTGRFAVILRPTDAMPDRSRMILTLEACNANGTAVYKDLLLRFSSETEEEIYVPPSADAVVMKDGKGHEIAVPVQWFVDKGLVSPGASAATCAVVAEQDADADGIVNWMEYVCGTNPCDAESKLTCSITFVDGLPNIDFSPKTGYAPGYGAVLKGRAELGSGEWNVKTTEHRFFRVFIERMD